MDTVTFTQARRNLAAVLDRVCDTGGPIQIQR
jgi:PHD/YefM family antitoxin component YafN of YafNO toxin-antitoxin module